MPLSFSLSLSLSLATCLQVCQSLPPPLPSLRLPPPKIKLSPRTHTFLPPLPLQNHSFSSTPQFNLKHPQSNRLQSCCLRSTLAVHCSLKTTSSLSDLFTFNVISIFANSLTFLKPRIKTRQQESRFFPTLNQ